MNVQGASSSVFSGRRESHGFLPVKNEEYIELPKSLESKELKESEYFIFIKQQLISNVQEMKELVRYYFRGCEYDIKIDVFLNKIQDDGISNESLSLFYDKTRKAIYNFVQVLKSQKKKCQQGTLSEQEGKREKIKTLIHTYCQEIHLCISGIICRFLLLESDLSILEQNITIDKQLDDFIRKLYHETIFMYISLKIGKKGPTWVPAVNEIHAYSALFNLCNHQFNLERMKDQYSIPKVDKDLEEDVKQYCKVHVNIYTVYCCILNEYFGKLVEFLESKNIIHWLKEPFPIEDLTPDIMTKLTSEFDKWNNFIRHPFCLSVEKIMDLGKEDIDTVDMSRFKERFQESLAESLFKYNTILNTEVVNEMIEIPESDYCIITKNNLYFYLIKKPVDLKQENSIPLSLLYLKNLQFSKLPPLVCQALLEQAIDQTVDYKDLIGFFVDKNVLQELKKLDRYLHFKLVDCKEHKISFLYNKSKQEFFDDLFSDFYQEFKNVMEKQGILHWLTQPFHENEMTKANMSMLESKLNDINDLRGIKDYITVSKIIRKNKNYMNMDRGEEKIRECILDILLYFFYEDRQVTRFIKIEKTDYEIIAKHSSYFQVIDRSKVEIKDLDYIDVDNTEPLQLCHLRYIKFSQYKYARLFKQAILQTLEASQWVDFFMDTKVQRELDKIDKKAKEDLIEKRNQFILNMPESEISESLVDRMVNKKTSILNSYPNDQRFLLSLFFAAKKQNNFNKFGRHLRRRHLSFFSQKEVEVIFKYTCYSRLIDEELAKKDSSLRETLFTNYVYFNYKNDNGDKIAHVLAGNSSSKSLKCLSELIQLASIDLLKEANTSGKSPLEIAISCGNKKAIKALTEAGIPVEDVKNMYIKSAARQSLLKK